MPPCAWNRRDLLRRGLAVVAGIAAGGPQQVFGGPPEESTRWALLSDTHIDADLDDHYRGFYPYPNLQEVAAVLAYDLPDALIITGDLIRSKGRSPAYENFKTVLTPLARHRPIYLGLGNHDDREDFSQAFAPDGRAGRPVANKRVMVAEAGPAHHPGQSFFSRRAARAAGRGAARLARSHTPAGRRQTRDLVRPSSTPPAMTAKGPGPAKSTGGIGRSALFPVEQSAVRIVR